MHGGEVALVPRRQSRKVGRVRRRYRCRVHRSVLSEVGHPDGEEAVGADGVRVDDAPVVVEQRRHVEVRQNASEQQELGGGSVEALKVVGAAVGACRRRGVCWEQHVLREVHVTDAAGDVSELANVGGHHVVAVGGERLHVKATDSVDSLVAARHSNAQRERCDSDDRERRNGSDRRAYGQREPAGLAHRLLVGHGDGVFLVRGHDGLESVNHAFVGVHAAGVREAHAAKAAGSFAAFGWVWCRCGSHERAAVDRPV
mmetsp:Transcript_43999/g.135833  ORF Transcript_43999/g.135833 Transcript_43999/m.135833 type:complete len:257 (-) Transcript_43999:76-846(-)